MNIEEIKKEINKLVNQAIELLKKESEKKDNNLELGVINFEYQSWYTKSLAIVKQIIPDRINEFANLYILEKRNTKEISHFNYTISDYLTGLTVTRGHNTIVNTKNAFTLKFMQQISILKSAKDKLEYILTDIKGILQSDLFDNEIEAAKELLKQGHLRASGTVAGVTLERHLLHVLNLHELKITKKNPAITDLNDTLKDNNIIDVPNWRFIQRLGDIRNYCAHNKEREPTKDEVNDLIIGVEKVIKTVF